jgi:PKD repeat protein
MRIYVDGNLILDAWHDQPPNYYTVSQTMSQGSHLIVVQYYEKQLNATAEVSWKNNSGTNPQAPIISAFAATPTTTAAGYPVALAWTVLGFTSVSIDNGMGDVTNRTNITVYPTQTMTYTLTASNTSGSNTAIVTVTVTPATPCRSPRRQLRFLAYRSPGMEPADTPVRSTASPVNTRQWTFYCKHPLRFLSKPRCFMVRAVATVTAKTI